MTRFYRCDYCGQEGSPYFYTVNEVRYEYHEGKREEFIVLDLCEKHQQELSKIVLSFKGGKK